MIRLAGITKHYLMGDEEVRALDGVDLHIGRNEYVALIGPSGSGKSTLMNLIGCLDSPTSGSYVLNGRDTSAMGDNELAKVRNVEIGFVFQSFHLLPRLTVLDNVAQPLVYRGIPRAERQRLATVALEQVGLGNRLGHRPNQLSGGQRQRVRRHPLPLGARDAAVHQRLADVVEHGQARQQVEALEHEADLEVADARELDVVHVRRVAPVEHVAAGRRRVEAADEVHQRRLAGARRADQRDVLFARDVSSSRWGCRTTAGRKSRPV